MSPNLSYSWSLEDVDILCEHITGLPDCQYATGITEAKYS